MNIVIILAVFFIIYGILFIHFFSCSYEISLGHIEFIYYEKNNTCLDIKENRIYTGKDCEKWIICAQNQKTELLNKNKSDSFKINNKTYPSFEIIEEGIYKANCFYLKR